MNRKRLAIPVLIAVLALLSALPGCSSVSDEDPGEDPMGREEVVDVSKNEAINTFLNQYNLDAEYRISNEDCSEITSTSLDASIGDITMRVSSTDGPVTVLIEYAEAVSSDVPTVVRDAVIALSPNTSYEAIDAMLQEFESSNGGYFGDYTLDDLSVSYMQGDGGMYQIGIAEKRTGAEASGDSEAA